MLARATLAFAVIASLAAIAAVDAARMPSSASPNGQVDDAAQPSSAVAVWMQRLRHLESNTTTLAPRNGSSVGYFAEREPSANSTAGRCDRNQPAPFAALSPITIRNRTGDRKVTTKLYLPSGEIDEAAAMQLDVVLADARDPKTPKLGRMDRRLLQLLYRTAYHFGVDRVEVTSAFRFQSRRREGLHALGRAIDFSLPGVKPTALASYLRKLPRVGVGIYTHRRTQFVHLDVRDMSYHWLDASPPGRTWRGRSIGGKDLPARDAAYEPANDWPEGLESHVVPL